MMRALTCLSMLALFTFACGGAGSGGHDAAAGVTNVGGSGGGGSSGGGSGGAGSGGGGSSGGGSSGGGGSAGTSGSTGAGGTSGSGGAHPAGGSGGGVVVDGGGSGGADGGARDADGGSGGTDGGGRSYSTAFPLTENPISEGGRWINGQTTGLDWHDLSTTPGLAIGHQSGASYTDGTALLTGAWGPTQTVEAVVHAVNPRDSCYQEVEMRLRSALSAHSCTGYEISFKATKTSGAYLIIVRWNGKLGDFTYLKQANGAQYGVTSGDVVKATIVGDKITAYLNGVEMGTATDSTYATGSPGMGFNLETGDPACLGTNGDYGYTSFMATAE